mmetsp:Transcript_3338/g.9569  ORF Transcript_3338/g.9569 Transcript_3338/m.9569 type:complete len:219 (-) Transcript_3338:878-1534(-)
MASISCEGMPRSTSFCEYVRSASLYAFWARTRSYFASRSSSFFRARSPSSSACARPSASASRPAAVTICAVCAAALSTAWRIVVTFCSRSTFPTFARCRACCTVCSKAARRPSRSMIVACASSLSAAWDRSNFLSLSSKTFMRFREFRSESLSLSRSRNLARSAATSATATVRGSRSLAFSALTSLVVTLFCCAFSRMSLTSVFRDVINFRLSEVIVL